MNAPVRDRKCEILNSCGMDVVPLSILLWAPKHVKPVIALLGGRCASV